MMVTFTLPSPIVCVGTVLHLRDTREKDSPKEVTDHPVRETVSINKEYHTTIYNHY